MAAGRTDWMSSAHTVSIPMSRVIGRLHPISIGDSDVEAGGRLSSVSHTASRLRRVLELWTLPSGTRIEVRRAFLLSPTSEFEKFI